MNVITEPTPTAVPTGHKITEGQCKDCGQTAHMIDKYGDRMPRCSYCMEDLNNARWAAEHGMPCPARVERPQNA